MIPDYFEGRKHQLSVPALSSGNGEYRYSAGFSWVAIAALLCGALPSLPRFLATIHAIDATHVPASLLGVYNYAWFVGFGLAFFVYLALRKSFPNR